MQDIKRSEWDQFFFWPEMELLLFQDPSFDFWIWKVWCSYYSDIIQNLNSPLKKLWNCNIDHFWPPFSHGIIFLAKLWLVLTRQGKHVQIHDKTLYQGFSTFFRALRYPRYGILVFDCTLYKNRSQTKLNMVNSDTAITSLRYLYWKPHCSWDAITFQIQKLG